MLIFFEIYFHFSFSDVTIYRLTLEKLDDFMQRSVRASDMFTFM